MKYINKETSNLFCNDPYAILDTILDSVILIDNSLNVIYANKASLSLFDFEKSELTGLPIGSLLPDGSDKMRDLNKFILNSDFENSNINIQKKDGSIVPVLLSSSLLKDKDNATSGIVCTFKDVSSLKEAEEKLRKSEESYIRLISNIPEVVYRSSNNLNWEFIFLNDNIYKLTGFKKDDFLSGSINFESLIFEDDKSKVRMAINQSVIERQKFDFDFRIVHKDGVVKWVHLKGNRNGNDCNGHTIYDGVMSDITTLKLIEKELHKLNSNLSVQKEELEYIVHIRSLELQVAMSKSGEKAWYKTISDILAGLSHELSTPLGMCVTALSYLQEKSERIKSDLNSGLIRKEDLNNFFETFDEAVSIFNGNLDHSISLVKGIREAVKDTKEEVKRNINLKGYVEEIVVSLRPAFNNASHKINISIDESMFIYVNPGIISQILTNLIMNSVIHGFEFMQSGIIDISCVLEGNILKLRYRDNGCGISETDIIKIFDLYYTTKKGRGGTGLGMNIVRDLVENTLKGRIDVESVKNQYTSFSIDFPV